MNKQECEEIKKDYRLHLEAGLIHSGHNEDGECEWLGTKSEWNKYNELINKQDE